MDDFGHRFASFYARQASRSAGEMIAGYLNHEDPRPHVSDKNGLWNRVGSALRGVLVVEGASGNNRPALAPIAGAFSAGFVVANCYDYRNTVEEGLKEPASPTAPIFLGRVSRVRAGFSSLFVQTDSQKVRRQLIPRKLPACRFVFEGRYDWRDGGPTGK